MPKDLPRYDLDSRWTLSWKKNCRMQTNDLLNILISSCQVGLPQGTFRKITCQDIVTLWLFNIAMGNGPFLDDTWWFTYQKWWFSMAALKTEGIFKKHITTLQQDVFKRQRHHTSSTIQCCNPNVTLWRFYTCCHGICGRKAMIR